MRTVATLSVLVIGRLPDEAARALTLPSDVDVAVEPFASFEEVARRLEARADAPELILLAEARGGEWSTAALDALRGLAPLARVWRMAGNWCEGEARSGRPPAGCLASYEHQWPARLRASWRRWPAESDPCGPCRSPPRPKSETLAAAERPRARRSGQVVIVARGAATAAALADTCRLVGYEPLVVREDLPWSAPAAAAIVWDTDPARLGDIGMVERVRQSAAGAPLVALAGFPRRDDIRRAQAAGIAAVVSKPFLIDDLYWQLDEAVRSGSR